MQLLYKSRRSIACAFLSVSIIVFPQLASAEEYLGLDLNQLQQLLDSHQNNYRNNNNNNNKNYDKNENNTHQKVTNKKVRRAPQPKKTDRIIKISHITDKAKQMLRVPYRWGGTTPKGFDCSGLVQYAFKRAGVLLPRTAAEQFKATRRIKRKYAALGDLLFFHTRRRGGYVNHVGIYLGNEQFIHAPGRGKRVEITRLSNYWKRRIVGVGRTL